MILEISINITPNIIESFLLGIFVGGLLSIYGVGLMILYQKKWSN